MNEPSDSLEVSVVIPWGRPTDDLARAVASVAEQICPAREIIVVANHSADCDSVQARDVRNRFGVVLIDGATCENANQARNLGVRKATSDWVAFLDADDWWDQSWLSHVSRAVQESPRGTAGFYSGFVVVSTGIRVPAEQWQFYRTPENYVLSYRSVSSGTLVILRAALLSCPWDDEIQRHQDYKLFVDMVGSGFSMRPVGGEYLFVSWARGYSGSAHPDCLRVVGPWAGRVRPLYYYRHLLWLAKLAGISRPSFLLRVCGHMLNPVALRWFVGSSQFTGRRQVPDG